MNYQSEYSFFGTVSSQQIGKSFIQQETHSAHVHHILPHFKNTVKRSNAIRVTLQKCSIKTSHVTPIEETSKRNFWTSTSYPYWRNLQKEFWFFLCTKCMAWYSRSMYKVYVSLYLDEVPSGYVHFLEYNSW